MGSSGSDSGVSWLQGDPDIRSAQDSPGQSRAGTRRGQAASRADRAAARAAARGQGLRPPPRGAGPSVLTWGAQVGLGRGGRLARGRGAGPRPCRRRRLELPEPPGSGPRRLASS